MMLRMSSGSNLLESSVDPTRSQNMTVSCRRSAPVAASILALVTGVAGSAGLACDFSKPIASSKVRRCARCSTTRPQITEIYGLDDRYLILVCTHFPEFGDPVVFITRRPRNQPGCG